ncbi:MAG: hypothetical protein IPJ74_16070 [Saprospiraceae bacterium]|nr:hypothetical protein [Saprospiraceae bacterium]
MKRFFLGILDDGMIGLMNDWMVRSASLRLFFQIVFIAFFIFSNIDKTNAQIAAPELICVKNDTLFWNIPNNTCGAFRAYNIYFSQTESDLIKY